MLGDLNQDLNYVGDRIASLDRPGVATAIVATLEPAVTARIIKCAVDCAATPADFVVDAIRDFVDRLIKTCRFSCSPSCTRLTAWVSQ
jgi:hypothetical protein